MKTAVSVPDDVYARAERAARRLGRTRSALYADALREYLDRHDREQDEITARLDALHADSAPDTGSSGRAAGRALVESGDWEW